MSALFKTAFFTVLAAVVLAITTGTAAAATNAALVPSAPVRPIQQPATVASSQTLALVTGAAEQARISAARAANKRTVGEMLAAYVRPTCFQRSGQLPGKPIGCKQA